MNDSVIVNKAKSLAPDRYLEACPIRYECRSLFIYLLEMEYCPKNDRIEVLLNYPEKNDPKYFTNDSKLQTFISDVKKFAFPYIKLSQSSANSSRHSTSLVQFYTFVLTDANRIRQYGFCRSAQNGKHILCIISYLPWYNVFINILNKISSIINEKDTKALYHFLEALYEYELPEPGNFAQIFSHDGLDQIRFMCPDRRVVPSIQENFFQDCIRKSYFMKKSLKLKILIDDHIYNINCKKNDKKFRYQSNPKFSSSTSKSNSWHRNDFTLLIVIY
ncbi:DENN domain-containing 1A [Brachionus plicatilis]|uniref:DENN domain-containing 1A n=1 Tax=Brachionus plicatilis TaxID=10195 RepID=A0A3M7PQN9_BRAPC|nr:DENN domain-containing 1A [Brachionus plicatilis]